SAEYRTVLEALPKFRARFGSFERPELNDVGYQFTNDFFGSPGAEVLYAMVRLHRPRRIVEIGCGHSTRVIRQAIKDSGHECHLACIDPCPRLDVLPLADRFLKEPIEAQNPDELAASLNPGDFLFIDTSHEVQVA